MPTWVTDPAHKALVSALIEARHKAGLSQRALADRLGWSYVLIAKVETNQRNISAIEFIEWCQVVDVAPSEVVDLLIRQKSLRLGKTQRKPLK